MKKYFIVSDVHSFYDELMQALDSAGFDKSNEDHIFVSLGDLLDRGPKSNECLEFVNALPIDRKILIRGNHEDLIQDCIARHEFLSHDIHNGTANTIYHICNKFFDDSQEDIFDQVKNNNQFSTYINSLVDYYDDGKNVFVHGWIPCINNREYYLPYPENLWQEGDWNDARWLNGAQLWSKGIKLIGKTIYCGHWHTAWAHSNLHNLGYDLSERYTHPDEIHMEPFIDEGIVALDACTAWSGKVNCYVIDMD